MEVEETRLPGVGLRHDLSTRAGRRVGVVSQVNGDRELVVFDDDDPDLVRTSVRLTSEEGAALADLLGAPRVVERLARLREQVQGLTTAGVVLPEGSPFATGTLGDTEIRTRTGASVVAVVRDGEVTPSPTPDFRFAAGDKVVVVGTDDGVAAVRRRLGG
ncbi:cation:proton antiporter regulatory subunit [Pseudokineococcus marinus]|uniref:Cation:proton antiporter regulatory subunit n=1 Tax=Pseudokineococcus marinus TaxID=351215 RepID=A0A849BY27_9ACTN|nr:cation:proton antiporter regulatory subunit [Pseudokineococcus marinus]NNH24326.1 cation:proton antiporter regulatory subunit [Pseudokineococcus marinus]